MELAGAALRGGVRIVQYRAKVGIAGEHVRAIRALTRRYGSLFVINDDWRAAVEYDADGVHVGPDDAKPGQLKGIRAVMGARMIGISCGTVDELRGIDPSLADYVGTGPVFASSSKADAGEPIGIAGLQMVVRATRLPVAAIGGITAANARAVRAGGVAMAAVISAIADAVDPEAAARELVSLWQT